MLKSCVGAPDATSRGEGDLAVWKRNSDSKRDTASEVVERLQWFDRTTAQAAEPLVAPPPPASEPTPPHAGPVRELALPVPPWQVAESGATATAGAVAVAAPAAPAQPEPVATTRPRAPRPPMRVDRRPVRTVVAGVFALVLSVGFVVGASLLRSSDSTKSAAKAPAVVVEKPHPAPTPHVAKPKLAKPAPEPTAAPKPKHVAKPRPAVKPKPVAAPKRKSKPKPVATPKPQPKPKPKPRTNAKPKPVAPQTLPPFAWSPVAGASAYDFQLFLGPKLVYEKRTTQPGITVPTTWTSHGRLVHLGPGSYRWYVWAIVNGARGDRAVVQAKLEIPG